MPDYMLTVTPAALTTTSEAFVNGALTDGDSDGVPDGFAGSGSFTDAGTTTISVVGSAGHSGGNAVRIQQTTGAVWGALGQAKSVTPGQRFSVSIWGKGTGAGTHDVQMVVTGSDPVQYVMLYQPGTTYLSALELDGAWHERTRAYTIPDGADTITLQMQREDGGAGSSDVYWSDLTAITIPLFDAGALVVIGEGADAELARIASIDTGAGTLTLDVRGIGSAGASAHATGARIAQVCTNWDAATPVMDLTDQCPTVDVGHGAETWAQYCIRKHAEFLAASDFDGIMLDDADGNKGWIVFAGKTRNIDYARTNTLLTDYTAFNTAWNVGGRAISDGLRAAIGDAILVENQPTPNPSAYDGAYREAQPTASWDLALWNLVVRGPYTYEGMIDGEHLSLFDEVSQGRTPTYTCLGPYATTSPPSDTDYRVMRFGFGTCRLVDAPFVWEPQGHDINTRLWADEFDVVFGLVLGDAPWILEGGGWRRDYEHATVLVNPADAPVTITLDKEYTKIDGSQQPAINTGLPCTSVTIPAHDSIILLGENSELIVRPPAPVPIAPFQIHVCDAQEIVRATMVGGGTGDAVSPKACKILSDKHTERLHITADGKSGNYLNTYTFTCQADHPAADYLVDGCHVIFADLDGNAREFRVRGLSVGRDSDGRETKTATCDGIEQELTQAFVRGITYTASAASVVAPDLLAGTRWTAGTIEWGGVLPDLDWASSASVWSRWLALATAARLEPYAHVTVQGSRVVARTIDLVQSRGLTTPRVLFTYGHNIKSIERYGDMLPCGTAVRGFGAAGVTMGDAVWSVDDGDALDKPSGQDFLSDPDALARYGILDYDGSRYNRFVEFTDTALATAADVIAAAYARLLVAVKPAVTYTLDAVMLERYPEQHAGAGTFEHEAVRLGDLVGVRDRLLPGSLDTPLPLPLCEMNRSYIDATQDSIVVGVPRRRFATTLSSVQQTLRGLS
jgi:phage minor structural protein